MDDVRGTFGTNENTDQTDDWATPDADTGHDGPPAGIGQDERRMQVRAYNHWASLLGERNFPSIEELHPEDIPDFGPNSVLLDFSVGIDDPAVQFLGKKLGEECGATGDIAKLSDVPARSLLSRITDHYMQILANEAPIGFEAEFVNRDGASILYRGILLPYSSNDETIDFIYGVINWKEMADQATADELLLEIDQALEAETVEEDEAHKHPSDPVTEWAASSLDDFDELTDLAPANEDDVEPPMILEVEAEDTGNPIGVLTDDDPEDSSVESSGDVFELGLDQIEEAGPDGDEIGVENSAETAGETASLLDLGGCDAAFEHELGEDDELPDFSQYRLEDPEEEEFDEDFESGEDEAAYHFASLADYLETPTKKAIDLDVEMSVPGDFDPDTQDDRAAPASETLPSAYTADTSVDDAQSAEDDAAASEPMELDDALEIEVADEEDAATVQESSPLELKSADQAIESIADAGADIDVDADADADADQHSEPAANSSLHIYLASARELAHTALASEDRSRSALYAAVSRAYDFSLEAKKAPADFEALMAQSGLSVQERAPMTPVVKLVFGSDYDKTRLTEYAAVLAHAHRNNLAHGALTQFLANADGGLKGVVQAERRLRREESGKPAQTKHAPRAALAKKLRMLEGQAFDALAADGPEFALVMVRRDGTGGIEVLGEIDDDVPMIERAAKKLIG